MSNSKFTALASLAVLAAAPMAVQAEMTEMADADLAGVAGQGPIQFSINIVTGVAEALVSPFNPVNPNYIPGVIGDAAADAVGEAVAGGVGAGASFFTLPFRIVGNTVGQVLSVPVDAAGAVTETALLPFTGPIAGLLGFNGRVFDNFEEQGEYGADTLTNILFSPLNFVLNPINRYVEGVNGRFEATVDGAAYAFTEVKGALIAGAFASASQGASNNGLDFTARVFGRISQAQTGLTNNRLADLAGKYGY